MKIDSKLIDHWNSSSSRIPHDKDSSGYAVDKEKLFPRNAKVCDLGGGMGSDSIYFLSKGHNVILLDVSDFALERAKIAANKFKLSDRLQTQQMDLYVGLIPLLDESFDIVYSRLVLHYFKKETLVNLYKEIFRILKTGGIAYICIKSTNDEKEMSWLHQNAIEIEPGIFEENGFLKVRFTNEQLKSVLAEAGIKNFKITDYVEKFEGRKDFIKSGNEKLLLTDITIIK